MLYHILILIVRNLIFLYRLHFAYIDGLMQERHNSIAAYIDGLMQERLNSIAAYIDGLTHWSSFLH